MLRGGNNVELADSWVSVLRQRPEGAEPPTSTRSFSHSPLVATAARHRLERERGQPWEVLLPSSAWLCL